MIRTVLKPNNQDISIHIPESFVGVQVEIIVFTTDEVIVDKVISDQAVTHFASQNSLANDWLTPEEDAAWRDL